MVFWNPLTNKYNYSKEFDENETWYNILSSIILIGTLPKWNLHLMISKNLQIISYAIVEELAELGASIHTCSRTETDLKKCLLDWEAKGFQVTGSVCDVSSQVQREKLINTVSSEFAGKLNILVTKHINIIFLSSGSCHSA